MNKLQEFLYNKNNFYNEKSIEEVFIIYKLKDIINEYKISYNGTNKKCYLFSINQIINYMLKLKIDDFYLCHNHPKKTPIMSSADYLTTQKIYLLSSLFDINLKNHYLLCQDIGVITLLNNESKNYAYVNNSHQIKENFNFLIDNTFKNFIDFIKCKYKEEIYEIKNSDNMNDDRVFSLIKNVYTELRLYEKYNKLSLFLNDTSKNINEFIELPVPTEVEIHFENDLNEEMCFEDEKIIKKSYKFER